MSKINGIEALSDVMAKYNFMSFRPEDMASALEVYYSALRDYTAEEIDSAFSAHVLHTKYYPSSSELRGEIAKTSGVKSFPSPPQPDTKCQCKNGWIERLVDYKSSKVPMSIPCVECDLGAYYNEKYGGKT